jgi:hypothetical protein
MGEFVPGDPGKGVAVQGARSPWIPDVPPDVQPPRHAEYHVLHLGRWNSELPRTAAPRITFVPGVDRVVR